jgi:galactokinase
LTAAAYRDRFGSEPEVVVTAPGRVNLIGDHTDYALLPVLPIAIDRAIRIAAADADDVDVSSIGFGDTFHGGPSPQGWQRYVAAAFAALGHDRGARIVIDSDLPRTGGLSSSSALTLGVISALDGVWNLGLDRFELPHIAIRAERSLGIEGGLMDQTVIVHAQAGSALRIDFDPITHRPVAIADDLAFVVAYSGSAAAKGDGAKDAYNTAVVSARAAAAALGSMLGDNVGSPPALGRLENPTDAMVAAASLPESASTADVAAHFSVDPESIVSLTTERYDADRPLRLRAVAHHILSESIRVAEAERLLLAGDRVSFGRLLDESHSSLRTFGSSTDGLDRVVAAMRDAGAFGARVTGAGFGGNAVAACSPDDVDRIVNAAMVATGGPAFRVRASQGLQ